jgi:hypothetical protein
MEKQGVEKKALKWKTNYEKKKFAGRLLRLCWMNF